MYVPKFEFKFIHTFQKTMFGFKGFMTRMNFLGEAHTSDEAKPKSHFCSDLSQVFDLYPPEFSIYAEVKIEGEVKTTLLKLLNGTFEFPTSSFHFKGGLLHSYLGPAYINSVYLNSVPLDLLVYKWFINGKLHSEIGPAVTYSNGYQGWYINGIPHRIAEPAIVSKSCIYYMKNGKIHNDKSHAIEYTNGTKCWFVNGKNHREDKPAIEYEDGGEAWYVAGEAI